MNRLLELMQKEELTTGEKVELFRGMNHSESKRNNLIEAYENAKEELENAESKLKAAQERMDSVNKRLVEFNTEDKMLNIFESNQKEDVKKDDISSPEEQDNFSLFENVGLGLSGKLVSIIGNTCSVFMNKNNDVIYTNGRFTIVVNSDRGIVLYDKEMSIARREQAHTGEVSSEFLKTAEENARFVKKVQEELSDYTNNGWKIYYSNEEGA